jgi:hypothetical protein
VYSRLRRHCDVRNIQRRRRSEVRDELVLLGLSLVWSEVFPPSSTSLILLFVAWAYSLEIII